MSARRRASAKSLAFSSAGPKTRESSSKLLELRIGERALHAAPEDGERADALLAFAEERNGETAAQAKLVVRRLLGRVEVAQEHGAGAAAVRRQADELTRCLVFGEPEGCGDRISVLLTEDDHGRVGARELADRLERAPQRRVEVECAAQFAEERRLSTFLLRVGERGPDLGDQALRSRGRFVNLGDLACGRAPPAPEEDDAEPEEERGQAERAGTRPAGGLVRDNHPGLPSIFRRKGRLQTHNRTDFANYHRGSRVARCLLSFRGW